MYFKIFISKSWRERFAGSRRRLIQRFPIKSLYQHFPAMAMRIFSGREKPGKGSLPFPKNRAIVQKNAKEALL